MLTISEALAEVKTINKRLEKKRQFVNANLSLQDGIRDPYEKDGGAPKMLSSALQSITDLESRIVNLRTVIQHANEKAIVKIGGASFTVSK